MFDESNPEHLRNLAQKHLRIADKHRKNACELEDMAEELYIKIRKLELCKVEGCSCPKQHAYE